MRDIHEALDLNNPRSRMGQIVDRELGKKFANQKHLLYDLFPDRVRITGKSSYPYLELLGEGGPSASSGAASTKAGAK